jgi:hypothetical protein
VRFSPRTALNPALSALCERTLSLCFSEVRVSDSHQYRVVGLRIKGLGLGIQSIRFEVFVRGDGLSGLGFGT